MSSRRRLILVAFVVGSLAPVQSRAASERRVGKISDRIKKWLTAPQSAKLKPEQSLLKENKAERPLTERRGPHRYSDLKAWLAENRGQIVVSDQLEETPMKKDWLGEDQPGFVRKDRVRQPVKYIHDANELEKHRLIIRDGKLYDAKGRLFDTSGDHGNAIYLGTKDGALYAKHQSESDTFTTFKHSTFRRTAAVGGEIAADHGVVTYLDNRAGHFRHSVEKFIDALLYLEAKQKLDMGQLRINFDPHGLPKP